MFSWLRRRERKQMPATPERTPVAPQGEGQRRNKGPGENPANPGVGATGRIAFHDGRSSWEESVDCVATLVRVLVSHGYLPSADNQLDCDEESGLLFRPQLVEVQPIHAKGARTLTTIEVEHPTAVVDPVFEFQHSTGATVEESIAEGFDQWCKTDLVALVDATRPEPKTCTAMLMEFPAAEGRPARKRRVLFGPVSHFRQHATEAAIAGPYDGADESAEHDFCPCCLFTRSVDAFKPVIDSTGFFGLRLYAMRDAQGSPGADCRVNGEDFEPGKERLKQYVRTWPDAGVEFRKQYVIVQDA